MTDREKSRIWRYVTEGPAAGRSTLDFFIGGFLWWRIWAMMVLAMATLLGAGVVLDYLAGVVESDPLIIGFIVGVGWWWVFKWLHSFIEPERDSP